MSVEFAYNTDALRHFEVHCVKLMWWHCCRIPTLEAKLCSCLLIVALDTDYRTTAVDKQARSTNLYHCSHGSTCIVLTGKSRSDRIDYSGGLKWGAGLDAS